MNPFMGDSVTWDAAEMKRDSLLSSDMGEGLNDTDSEDEWLDSDGETWLENCDYDPAQQNNYSPNPVGDISYQTLVNRSPDCGAYVGTYEATIEDFQQDI